MKKVNRDVNKLTKYVWLYEVATWWDSSWGHKAKYFLRHLAQDAASYSKVKLIKNVPEALEWHLSHVGNLWVYKADGYFCDEGYGQPLVRIPKVSSCDPLSYILLYAGYSEIISNADIRGDGDAFYETTDRILPENTNVEKFLESATGEEKPAWWNKFYGEVIEGNYEI